MTEVLVPVFRLEYRYGIAKSCLWSRMAAIGIKPERRGRYSFITPDQLKRLDRLDKEFLCKGDRQRISAFLAMEEKERRCV